MVTFGAGSVNHLTTVMLQNAAGIKLGNNVSFRGSGDSNIQVMSGELPMMFDSMTSVLPHIKSGKLRGLAVSTSARSPFLLELPTVAESGYAGFEVAGWTGILAPAKTPVRVVEQLQRDFAAAYKQPDVAARLFDGGFDAGAMTPKETTAFIDAEMKKWGKLIREAGIKGE